VGAFLKGCDNLIPFDGRNWGRLKFEFPLLCRAFGLKGFLENPAPWGAGYAYPQNDPQLGLEYQQKSVAVNNGLYRSCTEVERYKIKQYAEGNYPGAEAWAFLAHEYASECQTTASNLLHQLQTRQLVPGQAEAYIVEKLELRDQLFAISPPVTTMSFNAYLINGIPEEWETFKTTMRGQIRSLSESDLIAYIKGEDKRLDIKSRADMVYAARAPSKGRKTKAHTQDFSKQTGKDTAHCTYCNKDGHIAAKCWNKPPFYCPRCKTQGHNLQSCPDKGKTRAEKANSAK
jgi:hypothetical protein